MIVCACCYFFLPLRTIDLNRTHSPSQDLLLVIVSASWAVSLSFPLWVLSTLHSAWHTVDAQQVWFGVNWCPMLPVNLSVLAWNQQIIYSHQHCQVIFDLVEINRRIQWTKAIHSHSQKFILANVHTPLRQYVCPIFVF